MKDFSINKLSPLFNGLKNVNCIKTQRLTITPITLDDANDYYALYTDQELNKFWGYDYTEDLPPNPTPKDFIEFMNVLKESGEEISFAVRLNGKMIGELVVHNFSPLPSCEIGYRFFSHAQGKGYAFESAKGLIDYIFKTLSAKKTLTRCFKQNVASKNLALRLGYVQTNEDATHYYFEKTE